MFKSLLLIAMFIFIENPIEAQFINSNKTTVAEFFDGNVNRIELNGGKATIQFLIPGIQDTSLHRNKSNHKRSAIKVKSLFANLGINHTGPIFDVDKFNFKKRTGLIGGLTYQHSFNKLYLSVDDDDDFIFNQIAWQAGLLLTGNKFDNIKSTTSEIETASQPTITLEGSISRYYFGNRHKTKSFRNTFVPTGYLSINISGINSDSLTNYVLVDENQPNSPTFTVTGAKQFDGKFGPVVNQKSMVLAFSCPIIPTTKLADWDWMPIIGYIPYSTYQWRENADNRLNMGIAIALLSSPIKGSKVKAEEGTNNKYRDFSIPNFLSIGFDWTTGENDFDMPNIFLAGSVKF